MAVAHADDRTPCAGQKQAAILATLAMNANRRVPIDELIVGAWGFDASVSSATVENHIWRLRRLLDPGYSKSSSSVLVNDSGGYRLRLASGALDSTTFEELAEGAGRALEDASPEAAFALCDEALALWRGVPYDVIAHVPATAAATARLEEIRGQVVERRIESMIRTHRTTEALADLEVLTVRFPYRERLWAQRMSALMTSGRAEEALATYQQVRTMMRDELGIDPGVDLRQLQQEILEGHHPENEEHVRRSAPASRLSRVHLPRHSLPLIGRAAEVANLSAEINAGSLVTVTGTGGSGKTRLAIEVARLVAERFPDGVWFVDLTAITDSRLVPDAVISTLGLSAANTDALSSLRSFTHERQVLLLIDNCEHVLDGAAALAAELSGSDTGSVLLATSRQPLEIEGERLWSLQPLMLGSDEQSTTSISTAAEFFISRLDSGFDHEQEVAVVEKICRAVDGLPLALELAAARAQVFSLPEILTQVRDDPSRLGRLGRGNDDHRASVWSAIEWSHRLLEPADQATHRRLSVLPGSFTLSAATAVAQGPNLDVEDIPAALARLVHRSLLVSSPPAVRGRSTMFRQLDTVRAHARQLLDDTGESAETVARRDRWVSQLLGSRPRLGTRPEKAHFDNIDDAYPVIRATLQSAIQAAPKPDLLLAGASLHFYSFCRQRMVETRNWAASVAKAACWDQDAGPPVPEVVVFRLYHASMELISGDIAVARAELDLALPFVSDVPDHLVLDLGEQLAGAAQSAWARTEFTIAQELGEALRGVAARSEDPHLLLLADQVECFSGLMSRDPTVTAAQAEELFHRGVDAENLLTQWSAAAICLTTATMAGDSEAGLLWVDRLIPINAYFGTGGGGALIEMLANLAATTGDHELAVRMGAAGKAESRRVGLVWPAQPMTADLLAIARSAMSPERFAHLWAEGSELTYEQVALERGLIPQF